MTYKEAFLALENDQELQTIFRALPLSYLHEVAEFLDDCKDYPAEKLVNHFKKNIELSSLAMIAVKKKAGMI